MSTFLTPSFPDFTGDTLGVKRRGHDDGKLSRLLIVEFDLISGCGSARRRRFPLIHPTWISARSRNSRRRCGRERFRRPNSTGSPVVPSNVRFSNRPVRVKHFQTHHRCCVDVRSRASAPFRNRHQGPSHHGIRGRGGAIFGAALRHANSPHRYLGSNTGSKVSRPSTPSQPGSVLQINP